MLLSPFKKPTFVGLDLGHHSLKVVFVERTGSGWKVARCGSVPTPPGSIKDGVVVDQEAVTSALKTLIKQAHVSASAANIAVAGGTVVVRTVRIPKMPEATLRKSIKYEASRYVPNSTEDSYIEFEIIGQAAENQMDVLIVAAPKDIVESRVRACEAAGLDVEAVDVEAFAAYRSLVEADQLQNWGETTIALVDIGATTANMGVIEKGVFAMTRTIPHGGQTMTDALKSYFKLSDENAESGKAQLDLRELLVSEKGPKENPPLRVVQPHVDELVREIRRSLNYYQSQQTEGAQANTVSVLMLCGGCASMQGMAEYIGHKLSLDTRAISLYDNPRFTGPGSDNDRGYDLAVASGLAMRAYPMAA
jgi:type IV pilus assembly protein PilM